MEGGWVKTELIIIYGLPLVKVFPCVGIKSNNQYDKIIRKVLWGEKYITNVVNRNGDIKFI